MIRAALETSHFKREIFFITCTMENKVIIVIWPLFRKMAANQKPLNQIEIFWYQFTPRKLLYLMKSVNLAKFGPHWLSFFFFFGGGGGPPCINRVSPQTNEKEPLEQHNWRFGHNLSMSVNFKNIFFLVILLHHNVQIVARTTNRPWGAAPPC